MFSKVGVKKRKREKRGVEKDVREKEWPKKGYLDQSKDRERTNKKDIDLKEDFWERRRTRKRRGGEQVRYLPNRKIIDI